MLTGKSWRQKWPIWRDLKRSGDSRFLGMKENVSKLHFQAEKKRAEEERRRIKRDRTLLDKAQKDKRTNDERKLAEELDEAKMKVS